MATSRWYLFFTETFCGASIWLSHFLFGRTEERFKVVQFDFSFEPATSGWLLEIIYVVVSVSCWKTARKLALNQACAFHEYRVWQTIAILFVALCISKQLDLETALTEAGRAIAFSEGWYKQRQVVQLAFVMLVTLSSIIAGIIFLMWARNAPLSMLLALIGAAFVMTYLMLRAVSFHPVDQFIAGQILGLSWNWILQIGGIGVVLMASEWRKKQMVRAAA